MKIVVLERNSVGTDIEVSCLEQLGEVTYYSNTVTVEEVKMRIKDADIIVANRSVNLQQVMTILILIIAE